MNTLQNFQKSIIVLTLTAILITLSSCSAQMNISFNKLPSLKHDITLNISFNDLINQKIAESIFTSLQTKPEYKNTIKTEIREYNLKITISAINPKENLSDRFISLDDTQKQILSWLSSYIPKGGKNNITISYDPKIIGLNTTNIFAGYQNYTTETKKEMLELINNEYQKKGIKIIIFSKKFDNQSNDKETLFKDFVESVPNMIGLNITNYSIMKDINIGLTPSIIAINVNKKCYFIPKYPLTEQMFSNLSSECTSEKQIISFTNTITNQINNIFKNENYDFISSNAISKNINPTIPITITMPNSIIAAKSIGKPEINYSENINSVTFKSNIVKDRGNIITMAYETSQNLIIIISTIIMTTIILSILIIIYVISSKRKTDKTNFIKEQRITTLARYMKKNLQSGISIEISKNYLKNAGWPEEIIDSAIRIIKKTDEQKNIIKEKSINEILPNIDEANRKNIIKYIKNSLNNQKTEAEIIRKLDLIGWGKYDLKSLVRFVKKNK